ncbi:MAG: metal-dependent hydrolase, partial [Thiovulaceae bacterium]|nr:metal-dependent hydrolase [Sulfurimonadaceae bacterium]
MMTLTVRNPDIDLSLGFDRHWYGGNLAVTHVFNALSMLFPQGEKFFIDATKVVASQTDLSNNPKLAKEIKSFVSQEVTHSHHHQVYNDTLEKQGFPNTIEPTIIWLNELSLRKLSPLTNLAFVSAYEHYTAILGDFILKKPELLEPAQKELALVWGWHCVEETEHKAVCFDLYKFAGGGWLRRVITFLNVSISF